jgi:hypothetical protein
MVISRGSRGVSAGAGAGGSAGWTTGAFGSVHIEVGHGSVGIELRLYVYRAAGDAFVQRHRSAVEYPIGGYIGFVFQGIVPAEH